MHYVSAKRLLVDIYRWSWVTSTADTEDRYHHGEWVFVDATAGSLVTAYAFR
jgi:hypothetical protein